MRRWRSSSRSSSVQSGSRSRGRSDEIELKSFLAQPAVRAVADVQADQLVTAAAGAEVLGAAREGGGRGGERQDRRRRLRLLAGLAVDVDRARLGGGEGLAAGGRGPHPVEL